MLYAVLITSHKLVHYFQQHKIEVITSFPIEDILHNRKATGRIAMWSIELGAFDIQFKPCTAIKSKALVDFVAEWTELQVVQLAEKPKYWIMYFDGSLMLDNAEVGVLFISPRDEKLKYVLQLHFSASNNPAEYEALLHGLRIAVSLGV